MRALHPNSFEGTAKPPKLVVAGLRACSDIFASRRVVQDSSLFRRTRKCRQHQSWRRIPPRRTHSSVLCVGFSCGFALELWITGPVQLRCSGVWGAVNWGGGGLVLGLLRCRSFDAVWVLRHIHLCCTCVITGVKFSVGLGDFGSI